MEHTFLEEKCERQEKSKWNLGLAIEGGDKAKEPVAPKAGSSQLLCRGEAGTGRGGSKTRGSGVGC